MANMMYNKGREGFATGQVNWLTDDIRALGVDAADYTPNQATHDFLDDIPAIARVAASASFTGKTATDGILDANDIVWTSVVGDQFELVIIYKHTGTESTSRLLYCIDTATGLPVTPNGGNINVAFDNGVNKIAKL